MKSAQSSAHSKSSFKEKIEDQHTVSLVKDKKEGAGDEASEK